MSTYLQYLIWMMLFVIVIEMIFPDSAYRKYIKLVLGCILVYTMLRPIIGFVKVDGQDYKSYVEKYQQILEAQPVDGLAAYQKEVKEQQQSLESVYEKSMTSYIEQQFDVSVQSLQITFNEGQMERIDLVIAKSQKQFKVGEIHIGDKSQSIDGDEEELKNKIKTCLEDFYNVQVRNIYITVQKN